MHRPPRSIAALVGGLVTVLTVTVVVVVASFSVSSGVVAVVNADPKVAAESSLQTQRLETQRPRTRSFVAQGSGASNFESQGSGTRSFRVQRPPSQDVHPGETDVEAPAVTRTRFKTRSYLTTRAQDDTPDQAPDGHDQAQDEAHPQPDSQTRAESPPQGDSATKLTDGSLRPGQLESPGPIRFYTGGWRTDFSITSVPLQDLRGLGPGKDGIAAIDEPKFESIADARSWMDGLSPVLAIEMDGQARAYPMAIMIWHEIVNDTLAGVPIAVTFCPLCNTPLVFDRRVAGVVRDFGTTGKVYFSNLVMYDRQSETWWQQQTGTAIVGELMGTQLTPLPAQIISLDQFEETWPDGVVLSRDTGYERPYGKNPYPGYDRADQPPWQFSGTIDGRIAPKERVVTVGAGDQAIAFAYPELAEVGVASAELDGEPIVVFWAPGTRSALDETVIDESQDVGTTGVFSPVVNGHVRTFERLGPPGTPITDKKTGSTWSITGLATEGKLAGTQLEPIPGATESLWFAWAGFNPDTRIWEPPESSSAAG